jgi:ABC-type multidrug transport system ATPase subunit
MRTMSSAATAVVETHDLTRRYGESILALDGVSLSLRPGEVYGLIGPNGAGKTTFLRLILGLIRPTSGHSTVLGAPAGSPDALQRVGAVVEAPAFYPYLSGRNNLLVLARYAGTDTARIGPALERVGLADRARDKVSGYSLGMRQRLGLAAAFMKDPALYLLDEPTNGLDPYGIAAMRRIIRDLADEGRTVLLSSHLLAEVEQVCDRIGIIHRGRLLHEQTMGELRGTGGRLRVVATPLERAAEVVGGLDAVESVEIRDAGLDVVTDPANAPAVVRALVAGSIEVSEVRPMARTLEDAFMQLTGEPADARALG